MSVSPSQQAAIERAGQDACCVAGPGSGKTHVLVERFAWLIAQGVPPARILAITFTEKAAAEIKSRVVKSIRDRFKDQGETLRAVERAQVSTIHGLCNALLSEHAIGAGLDPRFTVLDEMDAGLEQHAALEAVLNRLARERRDSFLELASKWKTNDLAASFLDAWPKIRSAGGARAALAKLPSYDPMPRARALAEEIESLLAIPVKRTDGVIRREAAAREWLSRLGEQDMLSWSAGLPFNARSGSKQGDAVKDAVPRLRENLESVRREAIGAAHAHLIPFVRDVFILFEEEYARRKRALAALDFDDLEEKTLALLAGDRAVRDQVAGRFDAILMDELQDTNPIQWSIVNLIRTPGRFFAVGDLNQSIFGFRGAEPSLFSAYRESVESSGGVIDVLDLNYRSRQPILDAATGVLVRLNRGVTDHRLVAARPFPPPEGPSIEVFKAAADSSDIEWMARRLRELHGALQISPKEGGVRPARFSDMAVLARTSTPFAAIQQALARFGIPYVVERGSNFFDEPAIVDLVNLLRVLDQPDDDIALFGLVRSPLFGAGDEEIALQRLEGRIAPPRIAARIEALRREIAGRAPQPALARFLDETGYLASLNPQGRADTAKFFHLLDRFAAELPGDLRAWLDRIGDLRAQGGETTAPIREAGEAVSIMSMHKSKGLEFPVVALVNLQSPPRKDSGAIDFHPEIGLGLRWRLPGDDSKHLDDPILCAIRDREFRRQENEGDRLLYVAMTRAQEKLLLCWRESDPGFRSDWPDFIEAVLPAASTPDVARFEPAGLPEALPPPQLETAPSPEPLAPFQETAPETSAVAVTSLAVFRSCPWRYYLRFVAQWPEPEVPPAAVAGEAGGEPAGASFGAEVHHALAGLPAGQAAQEMARRFTASPLGQRAAKARRVFREFDFMLELEGRLLRGQIDLWFEDAHGLVLVDYKTDLSLSEERLAEYSTQLRFYALALRKLTGSLPGECVLFDLRSGREIPVSLEAGLLDAVVSEWKQFHTQRDALRFAPNPGAQCGRCPYSAGVCSAAACS